MMQRISQSMFQNLQILESKSTVSKVECYVCGKGLEDGHSITAKTLPHGTALFCDVHYPLQ